jgi:hypothetical protein
MWIQTVNGQKRVTRKTIEQLCVDLRRIVRVRV